MLAAGAAAWLTRASWSAALLVLAPSPNGGSFPLPDGAQPLAIERGGSTVRAWVFDPEGSSRGTVLLLHGIRSNKRHLVAKARHYAARGLRAIAVDSRGHGESTGRFLTYGVEEARDLVALTDALEQRAALTKPLSIVGSSYGGATALQYAALDPRVDRVAALASFASLREVVPAYLEWRLGVLGRMTPSALVDGLVNGAVRQAGFSADAPCPRCVAPHIRARVLLVHSRADERIPFHHSVEIRDALRGPKELVLTEGESHVATGGGAEIAAKIAAFVL